MASVPGSKLAFFQTSGKATNVVLTTDGKNVAAADPTKFNIEVFTSVAGSLASGYQASAFIQGAVSLNGNPDNNPILAASTASIEQLLSGDFRMNDQTGNESIQMGSGNQTVMGSAGDTITGGSGTSLIDISMTDPTATKGPATAIGGAGNTTVWAATGDTFIGGSGADTVAGNLGNNMKITGGAGDLTAFNLGKGNIVTGSTSGFTYIGVNSGGGGNTITGGAGNGPVTDPGGGKYDQGSVIIGASGDLITGGSGTMLVNALIGGMSVNGGGGASTIWGAPGDTVAGGSAFMQVTGDKMMVTGGTGSMLVGIGAADTVTAGPGSMTVWGGAGDTVSAGSGSLQFNAGTNTSVSGGTGNITAFDLGTGNRITGSTAAGSTTSMDDSYANTTTGAFTGGTNTLVGGAGSTTLIAGPNDSLVGGAGGMEAIIKSNLTGNVTIAAGTGSDGIRDAVNTVGGNGGKGTNVTVTGFNTAADRIESATSSGTTLVANSTKDAGGNVVLNFVDGTKMTIIGVTDPTKITFTS